MNCTLYDNQSRKDILHKNIVQVGTTKVIEFKEDTDLLRPTLKLAVDANSLQFNYVYLEDLRRYYYVNNIIFSRQYIQVELEVDVLMSFANQIMLCDCILERQSGVYNTYFPDEDWPKYAYENVRIQPCSNKFLLADLDSNGHIKYNNSYILITTGGYTT